MSVYYYLIPMVLVGWILLRKIRRRWNDGDLIIRCRHCHTKIDTTIHSACPNCGRSYEENRYGVKKDLPYVSWEEENSEKRAEEKTEKTLRRMNRLQFIGFLLALAGLISLFLKYTPGFPSFDFSTSETRTVEPNDDRFRRAPYQVIGDNVIVENEKVKVALTGFYEEEAPLYADEFGEKRGQVKLEFQVENRSEEDLDIQFQCGGINKENSMYGMHNFSGKFEKKSTTTFYESLFEVSGAAIKELFIGFVEVSDDKDYNFSQEEYRHFQTDATLSLEMPHPIGTLKYEGHGVRIYTAAFPGEESGESGYLLQVFNESGERFFITAYEKGFGESFEGMHFRGLPIQNGYVLKRRLLKSRKTEEPEPVFDISVSFMHLEDPSKNFSTGYFLTKP